MKIFGKIFSYACEKRSLSLVLLVSGVLSITIISWFYMGMKEPGNGYPAHWPVVDGLSGLVVIGIAFSIWLGNVKQEWQNSLPKRLTVAFYYVADDGRSRKILCCHEADLPHESDIRNWGQQLGSQMSGGSRSLSFSPVLHAPISVKNINGEYLLHTAEFALTELPDTYQKRFRHKYGLKEKEEITDELFFSKNDVLAADWYRNEKPSIEKRIYWSDKKTAY